jgi:hypothetical protein
VDEFEADEDVVGQLEHRQAAELGLRHRANDLVAEGDVEVERTLEVLNPKADVQVLIRAPDSTGRSRGTLGG